VLELCAGTLTQCIAKEYNGPMPPDGIVLYQIANGLHFIHSQNLVHRDVKPDNILISITTPIQMKLSDFGYVKKISPQGTFTQQSGLKGTLNWMAPEILELMDDSITELPHGTIQSDTFAAGCVFFYFLTGGKHPFGNSVTVPGNVLKNKPVNWMEVVRQINFPGKNFKNNNSIELLTIFYHSYARPIRTDRKNDKTERGKNLIARGYQTLDSKIMRIT
jgi:serine/threonine protein kinase